MCTIKIYIKVLSFLLPGLIFISCRPISDSTQLTKEGNDKLVTGNFHQAISFFDQALELNSKDPQAHYGKAFAYFYTGDMNNALIFCNKTIELDDEFFMAYYLRGGIYQLLGENSESIQDFEKTIELNSTFKYTLQNIAYLKYSNGDLEGAVKIMDELIKDHPNIPANYFNRGSYNYGLAKYDKALEDFTKVTQLNPEFHDAFHYKGLANGFLNNYSQGIEDLKYYLKYRDNSLLELQIGKYYQELGDQTQACEFFSRAFKNGCTEANYYLKNECK